MKKPPRAKRGSQGIPGQSRPCAGPDRKHEAYIEVTTSSNDQVRDDDRDKNADRDRAWAGKADRVTINIDVDTCDRDSDVTQNGGRPQHTTGSSDDSLNGTMPTIGDVIRLICNGFCADGDWPGPQKDLPLPYLFIRANPGDTGTRPTTGVFWESPDIFVLPGIAPQLAPPIPATLGGVAQANADNTIYAHIWNLGLAAAYEILVEFYWFNPTLGFNSASANLIGSTITQLGGRSTSSSHRVVKCPTSWSATYVNGGHECLVVRISDVVGDPLGTPEWDASQNRHIGQRNIHVMSAADAKAQLNIGIQVGPLFGGPAMVQVARADPGDMPWLHLVTMNRASTFTAGPSTGTTGISLAGTVTPGAGIGTQGRAKFPAFVGQCTVVGDDQQVSFHTDDPTPGKGQANVYRVTAVQNSQMVGGYTVVILGD